MKFSAFSFNSSNTLLIDYLIVGGGSYGEASDNNDAGQGGGAGGFVSGSTFLLLSSSFAVNVGNGGIQSGIEAQTSSFNGLYAGAGSGPTSGYPQSNGYSPDITCLGAINKSGGAGAGQTGSSALCAPYYTGGKGGNGLAWLDGKYYAGGGGAGGNNLSAGLPGTGSTGIGGTNGPPAVNPTSGSANTGGGGGGAKPGASNNGGVGGSGVVIVRYAGTPVLNGGTITQSGSYTYHTFNSSSTLFT